MTLWTVTCQAPLSMGFSRQEYWSGLPFPLPEIPNPGIKLRSSALQADFFFFFFLLFEPLEVACAKKIQGPKNDIDLVHHCIPSAWSKA